MNPFVSALPTLMFLFVLGQPLLQPVVDRLLDRLEVQSKPSWIHRFLLTMAVWVGTVAVVFAVCFGGCGVVSLLR